MHDLLTNSTRAITMTNHFPAILEASMKGSRAKAGHPDAIGYRNK